MTKMKKLLSALVLLGTLVGCDKIPMPSTPVEQPSTPVESEKPTPSTSTLKAVIKITVQFKTWTAIKVEGACRHAVFPYSYTIVFRRFPQRNLVFYVFKNVYRLSSFLFFRRENP